MKAQLEQLKKYFTSAAEHHAKMGELHKAMMDECDEEDASYEFHKGALTSHTGHAAECVKCARGVEHMMENKKAFGMPADRDEELAPMPAGIKLFSPSAPNVTLVPRHGSAPIQKAEVAPQFRQLVALDEE